MYLTLDTICDKMLLRLNLSGGARQHVKKKMDAEVGIEPTNKRFAVSRLTTWLLRG